MATTRPYFKQLTKRYRIFIKTENFQNLPLKKALPENELISELKVPEKGYYLFGYLDEDKRNFKVLILDIINKKIIFYYQIM
jgi:hypothetical protein